MLLEDRVESVDALTASRPPGERARATPPGHDASERERERATATVML